ncbi:MAG: 50S ribosomal protein L11 methyltransferase [Desulfosarcinaceae bacterium]|nr:50S ribosomal protein L11 methyltransferase [Desulfosarcinaceae bacterium]
MPNPYDLLYIYYLEGRLPPAATCGLTDFYGNWEEDDTTFLFFARPALAEVEALVASCDSVTLLDHYRMRYDEWQGEKIVARRIGGFLILPPWETGHARDEVHPTGEVQPSDGGSHSGTSAEDGHPQRLILDPGVVFGSGTHPTTRDCLAAIDLALADGRMQTALDLGTGTGLLALALAARGCRRVLAVDRNLLAAQTAQRNVVANRLKMQVLVTQGDADKFIDARADLVVSNIHYDVMRRLLSARGFRAKKRFVLSGLLRSEARVVRQTLERMGARLLETWEQDGVWSTFYGATD